MPKKANSPSHKASQIKKTLVLLDTHAILHRAYHAVPDFSSSTGMPTGALYGLLNMFLKMLTDLKPDYIIACYDLPQPTFRHETYEGYKKGRKATEDSLKVQIDESRNVFHTLNIPIYEAPGFEADDMLGTIVEQVIEKKLNLKTIIVSGDMDTMQLIHDDQVVVYTLKKGIQDTIMYAESDVIARYGFAPALVADYKGLRGDPSDNIVGVPGIGEKTGTDLITKFGTIEKIYQKLHKNPKQFLDAGFKQRIIDLLLEHEESAQFSKILATIRRDAPIEFTLPTREFKEDYSAEKTIRLLREYEFRSLISKFENLFGQEAVRKSRAPKEAAEEFDTLHSDNETLTSLFTNSRDWQTIQEASVGLWILNSDMVHPSPAEILRETETESITEAHDVILKKLEQKKLLSIFTHIEQPLIPIVRQMSEKGIMIDEAYLQKLSVDYHKQLDLLASDIFKNCKKEFNLNSPRQLSEFLFGELGLKPKGKKNKTGSFSTRGEVLEELAIENPLVQKIIDYRELQKLLSTYIDVLSTFLDHNHRLHAQFIQHGTTTGRFSSQNPNLQNIPIRSDLGRAIRNSFIAPVGHKLVSADYSQIELRALAMLSGDPTLKDVFQHNKDIHTTVASRVFNVSEKEVTKNQRRDAKIINFGILYGMGITSLQKNLGGTRTEAEHFYESYFNEFPSIRAYIDNVKATAKETLETKTLFGRIRNFPMFRSKLPFMIALAERTAINAPIQGTNADIIKLAMVDIDKEITKRGWGDTVFPVLQIHDEIVYEVPDDIVSEFTKLLRTTMEQVVNNHKDIVDMSTVKTLDIPITVSIEVGQNLGEKKEVV
jgi:DNA polymerase-1